MSRPISETLERMPQAGDSTEMILQRTLLQMKLPDPGTAAYFPLTTYLGTNTGVLIDTRGFRGIIANCRVTAVAGAGTISLRVRTMTDILMASGTTLLTTTAGIVSQASMVYPGIAVAAGVSASLPLGSYTFIDLINSSAIGGNEVTCVVSYLLLP